MPPADDVQVPTDDAKTSVSSDELQQLDADASRINLAWLEIRNKDIAQRIWLRLTAVVVAMAVMALMALLLYCAYQLFDGRDFPQVSPVYAIALLVTPAISITSIAALLLIGAFRSFKETDSHEAAKTVSNVVRSGALGG